MTTRKLDITKAPEDYDRFGRQVYAGLKRISANLKKGETVSVTKVHAMLSEALTSSTNLYHLPDEALSEGPSAPTFLSDPQGDQGETDDDEFDGYAYLRANGMI